MRSTSPDSRPDPEVDPQRLTAGPLLARNTIWNLVGAGAPLLVALASIPLLIQGMGTDRFGLLTLAWVVIGYFGFFDLGLGRALTKLVADRLGSGQSEEIPALAWTAFFLMLAFGIVGGLVAGALTPWFAGQVLEIPTELESEATSAFRLLAISLPVVITTAGLRGLLAAYQRFDLVNAVRIPMGMYSFLAPLAVLPFTNRLPPVVAVLVAGRFIGWTIHLLLCFRVVPGLRRRIRPRRAALAPLLSFGSWMTVSNVVGPFLVYLDRFLIGAVLSVAAVAYYATPYEMVTKLWIIPGALIGVLFPAFATTLMQDRARTARLFGRAVNYVYLALAPIALVVVVFAPEGLELWLGSEFASESSFVLQWLVFGVLLNSVAQVAFGLVQGLGRPDLTARLHLAELVVYVPALWWLIGAHGIRGAAVAWVARVTVDGIVLFVFVRRLLPESVSVVRRTAVIVLLAVVGFGVAGLAEGLLAKIAVVVAGFAALAVVAWRLLPPAEIRQALRGVRARR